MAPAIGRFAAGLINQPDCPWLIVQGDEDELVDVEQTVAWFDSLEPGPELLIPKALRRPAQLRLGFSVRF